MLGKSKKANTSTVDHQLRSVEKEEKVLGEKNKKKPSYIDVLPSAKEV